MTARKPLVIALLLEIPLLAGAALAQNAVVNGDFASSLAGWTTSPAECSFVGTEGRTAPGAAKCTVALEGGNTVIAMRQCVSATAGVAYDFGGSIRLASIPHSSARGLVGVDWYAATDCSGTALGSPRSADVASTTWQDVKARFQVAPAGTHGARVTLWRGLDVAGALTLFFDDIFLQPSCPNTATSMCLSGRIKVAATFRTNQGQSGAAQAARLTSDSGYFTFFSPQNAELFVKTVNACTPPFNRYWFFGAGLTNVEVVIVVTDTKSGQEKTYTNPLSRPFVAIQDTNAFATCP